jgi:hypothetical protein
MCIFIGYRRDDAYTEAALIQRELIRRCRHCTVFRDETDIKYARPIWETISERIVASKVVLVLIGPHWKKAETEESKTERDWVYEEIRLAFKECKDVIPILLKNAQIPKDLPPDICKLTDLKALPLSLVLDESNKLVDLDELKALGCKTSLELQEVVGRGLLLWLVTTAPVVLHKICAECTALAFILVGLVFGSYIGFQIGARSFLPLPWLAFIGIVASFASALSTFGTSWWMDPGVRDYWQIPVIFSVVLIPYVFGLLRGHR